MTATAAAPDIAAFAASVRRHLDDLPAEDVDDLVDGLEADLLEQAGESEDFTIPDAATYAAELRAAAGLPERNETPAPRLTLRERLDRADTEALRRIRANRAGAWLLDFFIALRPVWWLLRGWAMHVVVSGLFLGGGLFPKNFVSLLVLGALVLVSVQWGRGRWRSGGFLRVAVVVISTVSAIALPFLIAGAIANLRADAGGVEYVDTSQPGLTVDGERVRNIFAYDADGTPLTDVQLFDQSGRPLTTVGDSGEGSPVDDYFLYGGGPVPVAVTVPGRSPIWNVYPLAELPADAPLDDNGNPDTSKATSPVFPFPFVPALPETDAATPGASPGATPGATPGASPEPTPLATP